MERNTQSIVATCCVAVQNHVFLFAIFGAGYVGQHKTNSSRCARALLPPHTVNMATESVWLMF